MRDTGTVFAALSARDQELAGAIVGSEQTFGAPADSDEALAESFQIPPTFQRESRATLLALTTSGEHQAAGSWLLPVANDISPTLRSVRQLAPNLENVFRDLGPLIKAGRRGIPALGRFLGPEGLRPMLNLLAPFLGNVAPAVSYLRQYKKTITDFLAVPGFGLSNTLPEVAGQETLRTYLKQLGYLSAETLPIWARACRPTVVTHTRRRTTWRTRPRPRAGSSATSTARTRTTPPTRPAPRTSRRTRTNGPARARGRPARRPTRTRRSPCALHPGTPDIFGDGRAPGLLAAP